MEHGWAINLGGGMHHASHDEGMGWSIFDDHMLAIRTLRRCFCCHPILVGLPYKFFSFRNACRGDTYVTNLSMNGVVTCDDAMM